MLPTINRLKKDGEFKKIKAKGSRFYSKFFIVYFLANNKKRIGVVVSVKISKKAVKRNVLRRWVKSDFIKVLDKILSGDYIVILKKHSVQAEHKELTDDFYKLLSKISNVAKNKKNNY